MAQPKHSKVELVPVPEIQVYSNVITAFGGPFDVSLDFGMRAGDEALRGVARVTMSYEHLASMTKVLQQILAQYTENFGDLPDPEVGLAVTEPGAVDES